MGDIWISCLQSGLGFEWLSFVCEILRKRGRYFTKWRFREYCNITIIYKLTIDIMNI